MVEVGRSSHVRNEWGRKRPLDYKVGLALLYPEVRTRIHG